VFSKFHSSEDDISHLAAVPVESVSHVFPKLFPLSLYPNMPPHYPTRHPHHSFLSPIRS
jgi:hypothetical protein